MGSTTSAPDPSFCGTNTTWNAVEQACTAPHPSSFCPTDFDGVGFRWDADGKQCIRRVFDISELRLGSNSNPPYGYKAKEGSDECKCEGNGYGLNSCGDLCCGNSPYNSLREEDKNHYYGGDESKLCWERDPSIK